MKQQKKRQRRNKQDLGKPSPSIAKSSLTVEIQRMTYGAKGLGFVNDKAIFIPDTVPGDIISAQVTREKKRFIEARLDRYLVESPLRIEPRCSVALRCGGCQWQMIPYQQQLLWKLDFVRSSLERIGKIKSLPLFEIKPSPKLYQYRNRVQLKGRCRPNQNIEIGYYENQSHELIPVKACPVAEPLIEIFITRLSEQQWQHSTEIPRFHCDVQVVKDQDGREGLLVGLGRPDNKKISSSTEWQKLQDKIQSMNQVYVTYDIDHPTDQPFLFDEHDGIRYSTASGLFQQINPDANQGLRKLIREWCDEIQPKRILDLFCGSGNLSLGLAKAGYLVKGIEIDSRAIAIAKYNQQSNHIEHSEYLSSPGEFLSSWLEWGKLADLILVDPPRGGLGASIQGLLACQAPNLIYVSCDPSTLARDLGLLTQEKYQIDKIICFDFFPHTYHVETVVALKYVP